MAQSMQWYYRMLDESPSRERPSVLVVEDDTASREALAALLTDCGFDVEVARDGVEGIEIASNRPFDVIVSDVCMPRQDGFDLVKRLRELPIARDTPVVLMSALAETPRRVIGLNLGADDFIAKPVDPQELVARVRAHLRRALRSRELLVKSLVDELTEVLNRRGILQELNREIKRVGRVASALSVMMVDVDDFKRINDTAGHAAGDAVLVRVARGLVSAVRAQDRVGRLGGDEFLIVLPDTDTDAVERLADRLRRLPELEVGISVGAATMMPGDSADDLVLRADREMYCEKAAHHAGRV